jgi:hypothetical protein
MPPGAPAGSAKVISAMAKEKIAAEFAPAGSKPAAGAAAAAQQAAMGIPPAGAHTRSLFSST